MASGEAADRALAFLEEMSPDLRGAAILDAAGAALAASDEAERWAEDAAALLAIADRAGGSRSSRSTSRPSRARSSRSATPACSPSP